MFIVFIVDRIPDLGPTYVIKEINFPGNNSKLYLKSKYWGITDDHVIIQLSTDNSSSVDSLHNYVYKGESFLFYKTSRDSLFLYVYKKAINPPQFNTKIKIAQIELPNTEMMDLFSKDGFKKKGLFKFE